MFLLLSLPFLLCYSPLCYFSRCYAFVLFSSWRCSMAVTPVAAARFWPRSGFASLELTGQPPAHGCLGMQEERRITFSGVVL
ncbi:hypothetical protein [Aeromonas cavernicola]|uniref:hypothetical protein n=1 Tax=Aeromonas cavernicola TaxID=1006623 RepID=UPI0012FE4D9D|nr:hypothetical protein [Aeromonas cavernicola]